MADSGIITMEEYGNVRLKLKERMDSDGINRNTLARRIGVRFEVVDKWYRGDIEKLDLDILARICCVLHCTVGDLLEYQYEPVKVEEKRTEDVRRNLLQCRNLPLLSLHIHRDRLSCRDRFQCDYNLIIFINL